MCLRRFLYSKVSLKIIDRTTKKVHTRKTVDILISVAIMKCRFKFHLIAENSFQI